MVYRYPKHRVASLTKRLDDLKGRKSHQRHETQIAFSELMYLLLEVPWYRVDAKVRLIIAGAKAADQHRDCCGLEI